MLLAIAPIVPILALVGLGVTVGGVWLFARRDRNQLPGTSGGKALPGGTDAPPPGAPSELVDEFVGEFTDGRFHETTSGQSIAAVVQGLVNNLAPSQSSNVPLKIALRRLLNRSAFNRDLFGEPRPGDAYAFEGIAVNGFGQSKHEDTIGVMRLAFMPSRNIDSQGKRTGPSQQWGDLWIPRLRREAVEAGVSDPALLLAEAWPDGTPATEPPPELLAILEERQA